MLFLDTMESETEIIEIGTGFLESFKYKKAIEFFTRAIEINPSNSQTFELRGIAWYRILEIENALADISKAIELDKQNHNAWYNKGEILKYKKHYTEAELCYKEADYIYPGSFFYITGLIQTSLALKKYPEAIKYCNQILKEEPADHIALYNRGIAYSKQINYQLAINDFLKLIETGKRTPTNYSNLGYWYSKIGELRKASNNLSVSIQLNPNHPYAINNLGFVKYLEGNYKDALELVNKSLLIDSSNSYAYKNRALIYLKTSQKKLALEDLSKAKFLGYAEDYNNEVNELLKIEFGL